MTTSRIALGNQFAKRSSLERFGSENWLTLGYGPLWRGCWNPVRKRPFTPPLASELRLFFHPVSSRTAKWTSDCVWISRMIEKPEPQLPAPVPTPTPTPAPLPPPEPAPVPLKLSATIRHAPVYRVRKCGRALETAGTDVRGSLLALRASVLVS